MRRGDRGRTRGGGRVIKKDQKGRGGKRLEERWEMRNEGGMLGWSGAGRPGGAVGGEKGRAGGEGGR